MELPTYEDESDKDKNGGVMGSERFPQITMIDKLELQDCVLNERRRKGRLPKTLKIK